MGDEWLNINSPGYHKLYWWIKTHYHNPCNVNVRVKRRGIRGYGQGYGGKLNKARGQHPLMGLEEGVDPRFRVEDADAIRPNDPDSIPLGVDEALSQPPTSP